MDLQPFEAESFPGSAACGSPVTLLWRRHRGPLPTRTLMLHRKNVNWWSVFPQFSRRLQMHPSAAQVLQDQRLQMLFRRLPPSTLLRLKTTKYTRNPRGPNSPSHNGQFQVRPISTHQGRKDMPSDSPARRWEYVKQFERPDELLPNTWIVVRVDGRGFTK